MAFPTSPALGLTIDPRIRQRRIEVRRAQGRRRLRALAFITASAVVGAAAWGALRSPLLDVDARVVVGARHTPPGEILRASGIGSGDALVDVDEERAARRVEELPWVRHATVRRAWPDRVTLTVVERRATAVARTNAGSWALVDDDGRVLEITAEPPEGLVELEGVLGPGSPPLAPGRFTPAPGPLEVVRALGPALVARTAGVVVVQGGELALKLKPRGTVRLGSAEDLPAKMRAVETVLASLDTSTLSILDVRFPSSPVLTRG